MIEHQQKLNIRTQVSFPAYCHASSLGEVSTVCTSTGSVQLEALHVGLSWALLYVPLPLAYLNLYPFIVINHNSEYNGFVFCETFKGMIKLEGDLGILRTCSKYQKFGWS